MYVRQSLFFFFTFFQHKTRALVLERRLVRTRRQEHPLSALRASSARNEEYFSPKMHFLCCFRPPNTSSHAKKCSPLKILHVRWNVIFHPQGSNIDVICIDQQGIYKRNLQFCKSAVKRYFLWCKFPFSQSDNSASAMKCYIEMQIFNLKASKFCIIIYLVSES